LRKLPARFTLDIDHLPITAGKVIFIRLVSAEGKIDILEQAFKIGKRFRFQYVKAILDTQRQLLKVYHNSHLIKTFEYQLRKD
jgi:putative transposase